MVGAMVQHVARRHGTLSLHQHRHAMVQHSTALKAAASLANQAAKWVATLDQPAPKAPTVHVTILPY